MTAACGRRRQRGAALVIAAVLVILIGISILLAVGGAVTPETERDRRTAQALAQAKAALIGFAAGVELSNTATVNTARPGDLPCPDTNNDGSAELSCADATSRLGRLPWRTLGLPDLRDGDGERLWYAVSVNFKNNPRTSCGDPHAAGCLNSDSRGTLSAFSAAGVLVHDGANPDPHVPSGAIAVIIAPGAALVRQGAGAVQARRSHEQEPTHAVIANPQNYLDNIGAHDNASFTDGSSTDGFIAGPVKDAAGNEVVNDRMAVITYQDLMPALERRVAREVQVCLDAYAAQPQNGGRYPWAADMDCSASEQNYLDDPTSDPKSSCPASPARRFGRIPDPPFSRTNNDSGGQMLSSWTGSTCTLNADTWWWRGWKSMVFYGLAAAYQPTTPVTAPACGPCLTVNRPAPAPSVTGVGYVIIVGGRRLNVGPGQPRATALERASALNYLEGINPDGKDTSVYEQQPAGNAFNDMVLFK